MTNFINKIIDYKGDLKLFIKKDEFKLITCFFYTLSFTLLFLSFIFIIFSISINNRIINIENTNIVREFENEKIFFDYENLEINNNKKIDYKSIFNKLSNFYFYSSKLKNMKNNNNINLNKLYIDNFNHVIHFLKSFLDDTNVIDNYYTIINSINKDIKEIKNNLNFLIKTSNKNLKQINNNYYLNRNEIDLNLKNTLKILNDYHMKFINKNKNKKINFKIKKFNNNQISFNKNINIIKNKIHQVKYNTLFICNFRFSLSYYENIKIFFKLKNYKHELWISDIKEGSKFNDILYNDIFLFKVNKGKLNLKLNLYSNNNKMKSINILKNKNIFNCIEYKELIN